MLEELYKISSTSSSSIVPVQFFHVQQVPSIDSIPCFQHQPCCKTSLRRETILLKLLVIPNDDLKLIVMRCLSKVPLSTSVGVLCGDFGSGNHYIA